jgi:hypothetical protein
MSEQILKSPWIEVELTLLSTDEDGRKHPLQLTHERWYRPHLVVGNRQQRQSITKDQELVEEYLGVQFCPCSLILNPGDTAVLKLELMYYPNVDYSKLTPNAEFTLREGGKIVGHGRVITKNDK